MKKLFTLLCISFTICCKSQFYAGAAVGTFMTKEEVLPVANLNIGYRVPYFDCFGEPLNNVNRGWLAEGGYLALIDAAKGTSFYLVGGKAIRTSYFHMFEIKAGYTWYKESNDDKTRNWSKPTYVITSNSSIGLGEIIVGLHYTNGLSLTLGLRVLIK